MVCLQSKFGQVQIPLIVTYRILIHDYSLHMAYNQDFRMGTSCLSGCQVLGGINIWELLLCIPAQWAWSGTYKISASDLNCIWCLMNILILCMQERIKNLQFGQNLSPLNPSRVHKTMVTISLTLLMSG